jgi:hypothetical protein
MCACCDFDFRPLYIGIYVLIKELQHELVMVSMYKKVRHTAQLCISGGDFRRKLNNEHRLVEITDIYRVSGNGAGLTNT